jgi:basic membrane lipoprotein Med (substrate-binding protein (PBP1-ABC) superfamily)/predicted small lipoprotein YifL
MVMRKSIRWLSAVLFAVCLAACSQSGPRTIPAASPTATPSAVPSPRTAPFALLMAPESPISAAQQAAIRAVETFCEQKGLPLKRIAPGNAALENYPQGAPSLVVAVGSGFGQAVVAAAQAHPEIRFVAVEEGGVQPLPNLLVIGGENVRVDQVGFLAGALATVENRNEYVGWIGQSGTVIGTVYRYSFIHGVRYTCPRCRIFDFELDASAPAQDGISAAAELQTDYIDTASGVPSAAGDAALTDLARRGIRVAGTRPDFFALLFAGGQSVGSKSVLGGPAFRPDVLLADLLPRFMSGEIFSEAAAYSLENHSLEFAPFPNDWISPGRQAFLQAILADLASGRLDIGVDPKTGEER